MTVLSFLPTIAGLFRVRPSETRLLRPGPVTVMIPAGESRLLQIRTGRLGYNSTPAATGTESTGVERHDRGYIPGKTILADNATSPRTMRSRWTPGVLMVIQQTQRGNHGILADEQPGTTLGSVAVVLTAPHVESIQVVAKAQAGSA